jgi:hypothetical protein
VGHLKTIIHYSLENCKSLKGLKRIDYSEKYFGIILWLNWPGCSLKFCKILFRLHFVSL